MVEVLFWRQDMAKTDRTYLDTSDGMAGYAERYGAKLDKETSQWYVEGEVPYELLGLIPKQPRKPVYKAAPPCPICGSHTIERTRKRDGHLFWGCSQFKTGCEGTIDYDDYLDSLADTEKTRRATEFFISGEHDKPPPVGDGSKKPPVSPELRAELERLLVLATKELGGTHAAEKWLSTPKFGLKGKTPLQFMTLIDGCREVEKLILEVNT